MSVAFALVCAAIFYAVLTLIGYATISLTCKSGLKRGEIHGLAPVVGFSVLTLASTYLVVSGIPLAKVSALLMSTLAVLSVIVVLIRHRSETDASARWLPWKDDVFPLLLTAILIAVPFVIGGYQFVILRGNGTDEFNYVAMADALSHYPIAWVMTHSKGVLAAYSPSLPFAQDLLQSRWSTSAVLAFASSAFGIAPIEFEYPFTLVLMLVLYHALASALAANRALNQWTRWILVAFVVGFWGQFVLDLRAFAQMSALPLVTALLGWLSSPVDENRGVFRYGVVISALVGMALCFQYPEIVVAYLPAMALIFVMRIGYAYRAGVVRTVCSPSMIGFVGLLALLSMPMFRFILGFASSQVHFAMSKSLGWEGAYFSWMKNPVSGLWGGGAHLNLGSPMLDGLFRITGLVVGGVLTIGVSIRMLHLIRAWRQWKGDFAEVAMLILALSAGAGAILLDIKGNPWAAGKVISFFSVLIPIWMGVWITRKDALPGGLQWPRWAGLTLIGAIVCWCGMNAEFSAARIVHADKGTDFGQYIYGHGFYRRVDADEIARIPALACPQGSKVTVFEPSTWGREFRIDLMEGNGFSVATPGYSSIRIDEPNQDVTNNAIQCVFADRNYFDANHLLRMAYPREVVAANPGRRYIALAGISGGYGVEFDGGRPGRYVFTGNKEIVLRTIGRTSKYNLFLRFCPGAIRKANEAISVYVAVDGHQISSFDMTNCMQKTFSISGGGNAFMQKIRISSKDPRKEPTHIGADPRDLRMRVDILGVSLHDHL